MKQLYYIISFLITFNVLYMCQTFDVIGIFRKKFRPKHGLLDLEPCCVS